MRRIKVFLSGAIENTPDLGKGWRVQATPILERAGFTVLDPSLELEGPNRSINEIVHRNIFLQKQADLLLVEYSYPNRAYIGTDFELSKAYEWNQPTIVWCHPSYMNRTYMRYLSSMMLPSLEQALDYLVEHYPAEI